jgi:hypothetical protein
MAGVIAKYTISFILQRTHQKDAFRPRILLFCVPLVIDGCITLKLGYLERQKEVGLLKSMEPM